MSTVFNSQRGSSVWPWVKAILWGSGLGLFAVFASSLLMPLVILFWFAVFDGFVGEWGIELSWKSIAEWAPFHLLVAVYAFGFTAIPGLIGGAFLGVWLRYRTLRYNRLPLYVGAFYGFLIGEFAGIMTDRLVEVLLSGDLSALIHFDPINASAWSLAGISGLLVGTILAWIIRKDTHQ